MEAEILQGVLVPLIAVGLAEMGDKTQISILLLSSRTRDYLRLLLGVLLAFAIVDGAAILFGAWAAQLMPMGFLKLLSGIIFVAFGVLILKADQEEEKDVAPYSNAFLSGFTLIFVSEWGDKTQIASAIFAAEYSPWAVFLGTMTALAALSILAIYLGRYFGERLNRRLISRVAGAVFILIGLSFLLSDGLTSTFADFIL
jgi:putative Ca2+/H+ antiporter (TMEM165/GDT1 family)